MGPKQVGPLWIRVDLGVIVMNVYSTLSRNLASPSVLCYAQNTPFVGKEFYLFTRDTVSVFDFKYFQQWESLSVLVSMLDYDIALTKIELQSPKMFPIRLIPIGKIWSHFCPRAMGINSTTVLLQG